jgi:hypothetical protein
VVKPRRAVVPRIRAGGILRRLGGVIVALSVLALCAGTGTAHPAPTTGSTTPSSTPTGAVGNFTAAIDRLVELVGLAGGGILALVWARVALSWFSNDITKKVQAKDRARDALVGTLLFTAAVTGLFWGLAHWVITGS